jgi:ATP-dependent Clp protease ATP-binding subunit ClpB
LDMKVERTAQEAAKKKFSPEFMNRLDKVVVFHPLRDEQLEQILEIELGMVQQRVLDTGRGQFLFRVTGPARRFLLQEGTDLKYGARHLKRAIEKYVVYPLANLLATEQVRYGDVLLIDRAENAAGLCFHREAQGAVISLPPRRAARPQAVRIAVGSARDEKEKVNARDAEPVLTR